MDIGGRKDKNNEKEDKKDKSEGKKIVDEDRIPRNKNYLEKEKLKGKQIKVSDDGEDVLDHWYWGKFLGIVSNVLKQEEYPSCWAIAFIRCIEALFNIGKRIEEQRSFSIQHLLNNVPHKSHGLESAEYLRSFIRNNGVMEEGFAHFHRENRRGRGSIFCQVYYGVKKGYPQRKK